MHPAEPSDELLQCFDENGNPTEIHTRSEVKALPPRWWYAVSCIWLVNDQGQIMCSKRSDSLSGNPGKWQTYFGGHIGAGLTSEAVAKRELEEEAGISVPQDHFHLVIRDANEEKKFFSYKYVLRFNGQPSDLHFSDNEVTEAKWMDMKDYEQDKNNHPEEWCNSCSPENQERILEWLKLSV